MQVPRVPQIDYAGSQMSTQTQDLRLSCSFDEADRRIREALTSLGMEVQDEAGPIRATAKRSMKRNRHAAEISIDLTSSAGGTLAVCRVDMFAGNKHEEVLREIASAVGHEPLLHFGAVSPTSEGKQGGETAKETDSDLRADIAAAKDKMRVKLGAGREIKRLTNYLWEGETVDQMTTGTYGKGTGLVVLTDRRLLFVQDGIMSQASEDFPMDKVSSVQWASGLVMGKIVIFASGSKSEISNVQKDDGKKIVDKIRHVLSAPREQTPPAPAAIPPPAADPIEQLKRLGELRDAGVLTPEEFDAKKADLLGRM